MFYDDLNLYIIQLHNIIQKFQYICLVYLSLFYFNNYFNEFNYRQK